MIHRNLNVKSQVTREVQRKKSRYYVIKAPVLYLFINRDDFIGNKKQNLIKTYTNKTQI